MSDAESRALLQRAVQLMRQGALRDAKDLLQSIPLVPDDPRAGMREELAGLCAELRAHLASKETALATVQSLLWELETAQQELRASELRHRTTLVSIGDGLISTDQAGRVEFLNPVAERLTGWETSRARGRPIAEVFRIVHSRTRAPAEDPVARALRDGRVVELANHTALLREDGTERQIADSCAPIRDGQGAVVGAVLVFRDVTDEYAQREQLRESELSFRALFENAGEGIVVADLETGALRFCNGPWRALFGYAPDELPALRVSDLHPKESRAVGLPTNAAQNLGESLFTADVPCLRKNRSAFLADVRATVLALDDRPCSVAFYRDVTERHERNKQLQAETRRREAAEIELRHSQKLQAVGQLASGIAHEINTPVQFVSDSLQFVADAFGDVTKLVDQYQAIHASALDVAIRAEIARAEEDAELAYLVENVPKALERSLDGLSRIATIVRSMKEFAHPDQREMVAVDLNKAIQSTVVIACNEYKYVADVETDLGPLPQVTCHVGDVNQVVLNLLVNASHAVADVVKNTGNKGRIQIRTRQDGPDVVVSVTDTGGGIPEAIRERIFEPFFTTKDVGKGTGQGLALARSVVVEKHGGQLTFESEVGRGTTFFVRLPLDGDAGRAAAAAKPVAACGA